MATPATVNPFNHYVGLDGLPLENGYIWFGEPFQDPEIVPLAAYWDDANTQPAAQPIRTTAGYPARNGAPAMVFVGAQYSMRVRDRNGRQVFYAPNVTAVDLGGGGLDVITASGGQTIVTLVNAAYTPGANALDVYLNGIRLVSGQDYFETGTNQITMATSLSAGDQVIAFARSTFGLTQAVLSDWQAQVFNGAGGASQNFVLTRSPGAVANLDVSVTIGGVGSTLRPLIDYTLSGNTVTITPAPAVGTNNVLIRYGRSLPQDALRGDLASTASAAGGAGMSGYGHMPDYASGTVGAKLRELVSVKDFGATGLGYPNDDAAAIQEAFDTHKYVYFPKGEYYIGSQVYPQGNSIIWGTGRDSHIVIKDGDTNGIDLTNKTGVTVRFLKMSCRGSSGTLGGINGKAAIYLSNSSQCSIENNFIFNCYNVGIRLHDSSNNTICNNYFGDWYTTGTANEDSGNIYCLGASSSNVIKGNFCLGANAGVGVAIHDYYLVGKQPVGNIVTANRVDNKKAYGILLYTTDVGTPAGFDCKTVISNNVVTGILGDYVSGASGAGIYMQGGGGAACIGNQLYNCCVNTSDFGVLAMAHITASITNGADTAPILVANNQVHCLKGPGIVGTSSGYFGVKIEGNVVRNDQTAASNDSCIVLTDCRYSSIANNTCRHSGPGSAIYILSTATFGAIPTMLRNNISNNTVESVNGDGITINRVSTGAHEEYAIASNNVYVSAASKKACIIDYMTHVSLTGNTLVSNLSDPFYSSNIAKLRGAGNIFRSNSTGVISLSGTDCTLDETNYFGATMNNGGGFITFHILDAAPTTGTWTIGDAVIRRTATVGGAKGWRCTAAGTPGTWTSEGAL